MTVNNTLTQYGWTAVRGNDSPCAKCQRPVGGTAYLHPRTHRHFHEECALAASGLRNLNPHAQALGRLGGSANTPAQNAARAENARLGGRPKKHGPPGAGAGPSRNIPQTLCPLKLISHGQPEERS